MPSAANIKVDKQIASETASVDSASNQQNTPIRQAIVIIEHKIRNLEKRKSKLESYRELQASGKDLNADQRIAVAKYDEVVQTLEFARDLCKQFQGIAAVADKEAKKVARKEAAARSQAEIAKVREVLLVQDALQQLGQDTVREDFLLGRNGAVTLSEADLKVLDDVYPEVSPKHEPGSPANFTNHVQTAAEHLIAIVDGKAKDAFGSSYSHVKEIIGKIHESGYLDQAEENNVHEYVEEVPEVIPETEAKVEPLAEIPLEAPIGVYQIEQPVPQEEIPVVAAPVLEAVQQPPPVAQQPPYFQQPPQPQPQPRPISEVLGTGTFFFLQDSELDSPETAPPQAAPPPQAIPSQTFTNQNFAQLGGYPGGPNPPPPIPMPPSHPLPGMEFQVQYAQYPPEEQPPVPQQPPVPPAVQDDQVKPGDMEATGMSPKHGPRAPRTNQPRRNGPHQQGGGGGYQPYYNNNGYANNRPRTGRGGGAQGARSQGPRAPTQGPPKPKAAPAAAQH